MPNEADFIGASQRAWSVIAKHVEAIAGDHIGVETRKELDDLAVEYLTFWQRKAAGNKSADKDLEIIERRVEMLGARLAVSASSATRELVVEVIKTSCDIAGELLMKLLWR